MLAFWVLNYFYIYIEETLGLLIEGIKEVEVVSADKTGLMLWHGEVYKQYS